MDTAINYNKKQYMKVCLVLFLLLIFPTVSSKIIGGEVFIDGKEKVIPSWQNVFIYDTNNVNNYMEVIISPDKYRYSFQNSRVDTEEVFLKDSVIRAEVLDFENGYAAGPVDMILSKNEYNIFPKMEFREVVQLKQPNKKLIISKNSNFTLEVNTYDDCDFYFNNTSLCERGCDYKESFNADFGENNFNFITDCHTGERLKGSSREVFLSQNDKWINSKKELIQISRENSIYKITFTGTKSSGNFSVTDFIPSEFTVYNISNSGKTFLEDGYSSIEWKNIADEFFNFSYYIKPKSKIKTCSFGVYENEKIILRKSFVKDSEILQNNLDLKNNKFFFNCNFSNTVSFQMIEKFDFDSSLNSKMKNNYKNNINLKIKLSNHISNLELREYIPKGFVVSDISNSGRFEKSTSNYNVIIWNFTGTELNFKYSILPSKIGHYKIITELENNILKEKEFDVYTFLPPIRSNSNSKRKLSKSWNNSNKLWKYNPENFSKTTPSKPLIKEIDDIRIALFPKVYVDKGSFDIFKLFNIKNFDRRLDYIKSYTIETNLNSSERGNMKFEYKVNKTFMEENSYRDIKFKTKRKGRFFTITGGVISSTDSTITYGFNSPVTLSEFFIFAEKNKLNFREKLQISFDKIWFYILNLKRVSQEL